MLRFHAAVGELRLHELIVAACSAELRREKWFDPPEKSSQQLKKSLERCMISQLRPERQPQVHGGDQKARSLKVSLQR